MKKSPQRGFRNSYAGRYQASPGKGNGSPAKASPKKRYYDEYQPLHDAERYLSKQVTRPGQEYDKNRLHTAKQVLDEMVNHMPKEVYQQLISDVMHDANPETVRTLLAYRQH